MRNVCPSRVRLFALVALLSSLAVAVPAHAGQAAGPSTTAQAPASEAPAIRRWLDVQQLQISSRFRWYRGTDGRINSSSLQWSPQVRARLLFDRSGRYSVNVGTYGGSSIQSGWNNTGAGLGDFAGTVNVEQLFLQARPNDAIEIQFGGLGMYRGLSTEITTWDSDTYMAGERLIVKPGGRVTEVALTTGYLGDRREPNFFKRADRLGDFNFAQLGLGAHLHPRVEVSGDYTYEDGRDTLRQAVTISLPTPGRLELQLEAYERVSPDTAQGFNAYGEVRPHGRLRIGAGVTSIDRRYGGLNGDKYDDGTRAYGDVNLRLTGDLSLSFFATQAFATDYAIENERRWDIQLNFNPTARLKRLGVF
ncbi:MAG: hypothetical protein AB7O67_02830 [Vicinamibacterales bacterium]